MASLRRRKRKDGSTSWAVLFTLDGRQTSVTFGDEASAEKFRRLVDSLGGVEALKAAGIADTAKHQPGGYTLAEWLKHYVEHLTGVEKMTVHRYRRFAERDINPHLGDCPLPVLSHDVLGGWVRRLEESGSSAKTVKNKRDFLASALNAAVRAGHIPGRGDKREMVFLTQAEYQILKEALTPHWRPLVEFLVASGCRWSEATALQPNDVDRLAGTVRINKAWKSVSGAYARELGVPKTRKSVRTISVAPTVLDQLDYSHEWLFVNKAGNPVQPHTFHYAVWRPALRRAKEKGLVKQPRIHDLRHTCASWMIQAGTPITVVQRHLGHESIQTTSDVYGHIDRTSAEAAAASVAAMLGN